MSLQILKPPLLAARLQEPTQGVFVGSKAGVLLALLNGRDDGSYGRCDLGLPFLVRWSADDLELPPKSVLPPVALMALSRSGDIGTSLAGTAPNPLASAAAERDQCFPAL